MLKYVSVAAVSVAALAATPAMAQDEAKGSFYAGALVGLDSVNASDGVDDGSEEDILYGVVAGYDFATGGNVVFGIEAELTDSSVGQSETDVFVAGDQVSVKAGRDIYVGARVGTKVGSGLLYVKGGYTNAAIKGEYDDGVDFFSATEELDGFRVGAGAEFPVGNNFAVRVEYRYSDYGEFEFLGAGTGISFSRNQGVIGFIGKF